MYIEEAPRPMVFQLSDLAKMYSCLLEQLGGHVPGRVNSTRLKDRLLAQIPELGAYTEGKEVKLAFLAILAPLYTSPKIMTMTLRPCILPKRQCLSEKSY